MANTFITIKDEDGILRPKAILENDDDIGLNIVKNAVAKWNAGDKVVRIEVVEKAEL